MADSSGGLGALCERANLVRDKMIDDTSINEPHKAAWTPEIPTRLGWYWCWDGIEIWPVKLEDIRGYLIHRLDGAIWESVENTGTHWKRIENVPEPPRHE